MPYKIVRSITVALTLAMPLIFWFVGDFISNLPGNQSFQKLAFAAICRVWALQMAVALFSGAIWPTNPRDCWPRARILALLGGMVGTVFFRSDPRLWVWWMPLVLAIFGLMQVTVMGLSMGSNLRRPHLNPNIR